jgi:hypothetical protein
MSKNELLEQKLKLQHDINIGIDTEDTWIDLDMVNFALKLLINN